MVHVSVTVDRRGCLVELRASGHVGIVGGRRGANVVCAAVTGVVKACATAIAENAAIVSDGSAPEEGSLSIRVLSVGSNEGDFLRGVTAVLISGIRALAVDSSSEVKLTVTQNRS